MNCKTQIKIIALLLADGLLLCACGKKVTAPTPATSQETVECVMESIKNLDLETLNQYTDNYIETYHNWIGVPIEKEYRIFNELLQPRSKHGKRYQSAYKLDQKIMENLTWQIYAVREDSTAAEIDMTITNIDMAKVMEKYENHIIENILESPGLGFARFITDMSELAAGKDTLISYIDNLEDSDLSILDVTVTADQENGKWTVHLSPDFINAFLGNMYTDTCTENIEQHTDELEKKMEDKMNQWADGIEAKYSQLFLSLESAEVRQTTVVPACCKHWAMVCLTKKEIRFPWAPKVCRNFAQSPTILSFQHSKSAPFKLPVM